jgi:hypothetical protein
MAGNGEADVSRLGAATVSVPYIGVGNCTDLTRSTILSRLFGIPRQSRSTLRAISGAKQAAVDFRETPDAARYRPSLPAWTAV